MAGQQSGEAQRKKAGRPKFTNLFDIIDSAIKAFYTHKWQLVVFILGTIVLVIVNFLTACAPFTDFYFRFGPIFYLIALPLHFFFHQYQYAEDAEDLHPLELKGRVSFRRYLMNEFCLQKVVNTPLFRRSRFFTSGAGAVILFVLYVLGMLLFLLWPVPSSNACGLYCTFQAITVPNYTYYGYRVCHNLTLFGPISDSLYDSVMMKAVVSFMSGISQASVYVATSMLIMYICLFVGVVQLLSSRLHHLSILLLSIDSKYVRYIYGDNYIGSEKLNKEWDRLYDNLKSEASGYVKKANLASVARTLMSNAGEAADPEDLQLQASSSGEGGGQAENQAGSREEVRAETHNDHHIRDAATRVVKRNTKKVAPTSALGSARHQEVTDTASIETIVVEYGLSYFAAVNGYFLILAGLGATLLIVLMLEGGIVGEYWAWLFAAFLFICIIILLLPYVYLNHKCDRIKELAERVEANDDLEDFSADNFSLKATLMGYVVSGSTIASFVATAAGTLVATVVLNRFGG
mmetsp:Transcript_36211/g.94187  ORF Transcript_36211/g.94187 Transcript_36211/m.94187 type:complete len:519 (-) Transcript_36211:207-1763(-)